MAKEPPKKPKPKKQPHKKVFDVVPPGKVPASPTSRPVIIGHKASIQDDQFVPPSKPSAPLLTHEAVERASKRPLMGGHKKLPLKAEANGASEGEPSPLKEAEAQSSEVGSVPGAGKVSTPEEIISEAEALPPGESPSPPVPASNSTPTGLDGQADTTGTDQSGQLDDKTTPEQLAVEQVVEAEEATGSDTSEAGATPDSKPSAMPAQPSPIETIPSEPIATAEAKPKTVDDLLAETGAPDLDEPQEAIISHHHRPGWGRSILLIVLTLILAVIALNLLIDAEIISFNVSVPHTDLF